MRGLDVGRSMVRTVVETLGELTGRVSERRPLDADVYEDEDAFLVIFDAPGAGKGDVQVSYSDDTVSVRIDRFRDFYEGFEMRFPGRGMRLEGAVTLPKGAAVEVHEAAATLTDTGTLEIRIPKDEVSVPIGAEPAGGET